MTEKLEVLLGIHNPHVRITLAALLTESYEVTAVATREEMYAMLGIGESSHAAACTYGVVIMDVNLGMPGADNIEPGREVHRYLQPLIDEGRVKFTAVSANDFVVERAIKEGVPCIPKLDIFTYI